MTKKSIATALALGFFAYVLPVMTAQAGCVWRGSAPYCDDHCANGETLSRTRQDGCVFGNKEFCCTPEETPPPAADSGSYERKHGTHLPTAPATEDKKTPSTGNAATELDTGAKEDKKPPYGKAATELQQKQAETPTGQPADADGDDDGHKHKDDDGHKHNKHKKNHHHHDDDDDDHN